MSASSQSPPATFEGPERRVEGDGKVRGSTRFITDLQPRGVLHLAYATSPVAHATVRSVETRAARAVPGVIAVVTGEDAAPIRMGRRLQDWPLLAWDRVRFVGERVAAVAATSIEQAQEAAAAIEVEYDELPPVWTIEAALATDAPILHPDSAEYRYLGGQRAPVSHPNVQGEVMLLKGIVDEAAFERLFDDLSRVVSSEFRVGRQHQGALEPHAAIVTATEELIVVETTNKSPFLLRGQMAAALGMAADEIDVRSGAIGGDFGSKGLSIDEYACLLLARATGRPVRVAAHTDEEMSAYAPRHGAVIRLRSLLDHGGRILAHDADVLYDGGAYAAGKPIPELIPPGGLDVLAPYDVPHMRLRIRSVYTNSLPGGHMRCPGEIQTVFASESHVDLLARSAGADPLAFRRANLARQGSLTIAGERMRAPIGDRVLDAIARETRSVGHDAGWGVALIARKLEGGRMSIAARVAADGTVELVTAIPDQGAGAHTAMARICAATLGIDASRVRIRQASTAEAPPDIGVGASRVTFLAGRATLDAAQQLRARVETAAAASTRARAPLHLGSGCFRSTDGTPVATWDEVAALPSLRDVEVVGSFDSFAGEHGMADFSFAALGVQVAIDRDTGTWRIDDAVIVADTGTIVNPVAHAGQLDGGFAQGLGAARMEELIIADGQVANASLGDYCLPASLDVPRLRHVLISDAQGPGAFGTKSAGEVTPSAVAPAVANAIQAAVGVRLRELPMTPERVLRALLNDPPV